uniref:Uncharacterized protein n=1 Tax=Panagrolaimus sp. JU765 TaxID=591449 RepID=A0AC34RC69_9BILA
MPLLHTDAVAIDLFVELYPPKMVKSICLKLNAAVEPDDRPTMAKLIKKIGKEFGYLNINFVPDFAASLTTELFIDKIKVKKYEVDDYITIAMLKDDDARIYLLRKQPIGWDVLDCQKVCRIVVTMGDICGLFVKNGIKRHQIKDVLYRESPCLRTDEESGSGIHGACEYLSKVFSGEDYFNDYDYFLGIICEERFWLKSDKFTILFPTEYKRLPFTIQKKLNLVKCNKIQLITSIDDSFNTSTEKVIYSESLNSLTGSVVVTLKVDENKDVYFKIEKNDAQKTLITTNVPLSEWTSDDRPTFTFGKNYVSVDYH